MYRRLLPLIMIFIIAPPIWLTEGSDPAWSPDGTYIAYAARDGLRVMDATGSNNILLVDTVGYGPMAEAEWSPNGNKIAFVTQGEESENYLYIMDADGTDVKLLVTEEAGIGQTVAWSPAGDKILYMRVNPQGLFVFSFSIVSIDADGSNQKELVPAGAFPTWSPDGSTIAYSAESDGAKSSIFLMNADGTNQRRLTPPMALVRHAAWAFNSNKILFVGGEGSTTNIFVVDATGGEPTNLTNDVAPSQVWSPSWSPDGNRIAFLRDEPGDSYIRNLVVMNSDGSDQMLLTESLTEEGYAQVSFYPSWSPDSKQIAFSLSIVPNIPINDSSGGIYLVAIPDK
jgi:Tol biopolymer transport system component